jgi:F0F1-type ATP synthase membrane subunit b/b'
MNPVKRYLLIFLAVYLVGAVAAVILWGPPGLSAEYRAQYKADHDRYIEITKSKDYKLHKANPRIHPATGVLEDQVRFANDYSSRSEFIDESRRRTTFIYFFDIYNAIFLIALALRFGKKPFLAFVDEKIEDIRNRLEAAEQARLDAEQQHAQAQEQVDGLKEERELIAAHGDKTLEKESTRITEGTAHILEEIDREIEDHKRMEATKAAMHMKRELVGQATVLVEQQFREGTAAVPHDALVDQFVKGLEDAS